MPKRFSFSRVGRLTLLAAALTASPTFADSPASADDAKSPFDDAVAFWNFADLNDANVNDGAASVLQAFGDVEIGVEIDETAKAESLLRGGDGKVARISQGGYLRTDAPLGSELAVDGSELTFCVRLRYDATVWQNSPIFSKHGGHERLAYNLYCLDDALGAEIGTTGNNGLLRCRALRSETRDPEAALTAWRDVVCRVDEAKVELFVDGRCYDEDFVLGTLRPNDVALTIGAQIEPDGEARAGFVGEIDHLAVWNRALSNAEIAALSGGVDRIDPRERTDLGDGASLQYWTPPNAYGVGDCMPFYVDGVFHFMYLLDKGRHGAKNGLGAHQWIQATSTDLKTWTHRPFVVPIDRQNEGSICTGCVYYHKGLYYAFYANRAVEYVMPDGEKRRTYGLLCLATSKDGIHFEKKGYDPIFLLPDGYSWGTRDPQIFQDPTDGTFHMYITTTYRGKGCWAHATSQDLENWTLTDPVYTHMNGEPECPDWFRWGDDYYVVANHLNGYYKTSKSPTGPWEVPNAPNILMPGIINVPQTAAFKDGRRLVCGWSRERGFGGSAVFHELIRFDDGTLGEKFVPEMIPETDAPVVSENEIAEPERVWESLPTRCRVKFSLSYVPKRIDALRDVVFKYADGKELRVVFSERAVYLGGFKIERVDMSSGALHFDCVLTSNLIDICVDDKRTLTADLPSASERSLQLVNDAGAAVKVKSLEISPLKE